MYLILPPSTFTLRVPFETLIEGGDKYESLFIKGDGDGDQTRLIKLGPPTKWRRWEWKAEHAEITRNPSPLLCHQLSEQLSGS